MNNEHENIYWEALRMKKYEILLNDAYLIKNDFEFNVNEQPELRKIFDYIKRQPRMCIAGGYPTLQYINKALSDFPDSDIDIFITNPYEESCFCEIDVLQEFIEFLGDDISEITSYTNAMASVYNIKCKNINRMLQIIGIYAETISEIFNQFDASHCKCCVYMGDTYVSYDAKYSKDTNTTVFYNTCPKIHRYNKAIKLGLNVYNCSHICEEIQRNLFIVPRTIQDMLNNFRCVKNWMNSYNNVICISVTPTINELHPVVLSRYDKLTAIENICPIVAHSFLSNKILYMGGTMLVKINKFSIITDEIDMKIGGLHQKDHPFSNNNRLFIPLGTDYGSSILLNSLIFLEKTLKSMAEKYIYDNCDIFLEKTLKSMAEKYIYDNCEWECPGKMMYISFIKESKNPNLVYKGISTSISTKIPTSGFVNKINVNFVNKDNTLIHIDSLEKLREKFPLKCKAKFEIYMDKLWIESTRYGFSFKCKTIIMAK